jgi:hypothetical protein
VAVLKFSPEADDLLTELESDPRTVRCAGRLNTALDRLEADPGAAVNRRRRFQRLDLWAIPVVCGDDEWLILWKPGDGDDVIVAHIVPAP